MLIQTELVMFASLLGPMLSSSVVSEKLRQYSIAISQPCQRYKILSVFVYLQCIPMYEVVTLILG